MLKLTLTSALVVATSAYDMCPKAICTGTATTVKAVVASDAVVTKCADVTKRKMPAGCAEVTAFTGATCKGTSTVQIPAVVADVCAFDKTNCNWACPAGCTQGFLSQVITGTFMDGVKKASPEVAATTKNACDVTQWRRKECTAGYKAATCTGTSTVNVISDARKTCVSELETCNMDSGTCTKGCKYTPATYTAQTPPATYDTAKIDAVTADAGTKTDCSIANYRNTKESVAACKTTGYQCKGTAAKKAVAKGGKDGTQMVFCSMYGSDQASLVRPTGCATGCTFTKATLGKFTGTSTEVAKPAVVAAKAYTPMCSTKCYSSIWMPKIQIVKDNSVCAPGCQTTVPVVPAVAPAPATKSSSASAATMAAATIALSVIAAIVAL